VGKKMGEAEEGVGGEIRRRGEKNKGGEEMGREKEMVE
jgi:hypothetical protein